MLDVRVTIVIVLARQVLQPVHKTSKIHNIVIGYFDLAYMFVNDDGK